MKRIDLHTNGYKIAAILIIVLFIICMGWTMTALAWHSAPKGRVSCSSFRTWEDANRAYGAGASWLDGNDKDGCPCESHFHHSCMNYGG